MTYVMFIAYIVSRYIPGKAALSKQFNGNSARMMTLDIYYMLQLVAIMGNIWVTHADVQSLICDCAIEDRASDIAYSYDISIFFFMFIITYVFTLLAKHTPLTEAEKER